MEPLHSRLQKHAKTVIKSRDSIEVGEKVTVLEPLQNTLTYLPINK